MGASRLIAGRLAYGLLTLTLCLLITAASLPLASADDSEGTTYQYIIEGSYGAVIEGYITDNETGEPIAGAKIEGEVHSATIYVDIQADTNGRFRISVDEAGDHDYFLTVRANGYDPVTIIGSLKAGECKRLSIRLNYHPFDILLAESSGSMARPYAAQMISGRRLVPFTAQRQVPVLDSRGNQVYDVIEERKLTGYTWEQRISYYKQQTLTTYVQKRVPIYRTERYISRWVTTRIGLRIAAIPVYSTRQVVAGYATQLVPETVTRQVLVETWITMRSSVPGFYADVAAGTLRENVRNPQAVYTTTFTHVPRMRTETYTAYQEYNFSATSYSFLPRENKQVGVRLIPRNAYTGGAILAAVAGEGASASIGPASLSLALSTTATLNIAPKHASTHHVVVKGYDAAGRLVGVRNYVLNLTESLPSGRYSESFVRTTTNKLTTEVKVTITTNTENVIGRISETETTTSNDQIFGMGAAYITHYYSGATVKDSYVYLLGTQGRGIPIADWTLPLLIAEGSPQDRIFEF